MSALARFQAEFLAALFDPVELAASPGLEAYRRNVFANLHDALASTYPVVRRLVGEPFFREAVRCCARAHPSTSGDLHEYGEDFAAFLATYPHANGLPYLADVARLEWAVHESFMAADAAGLDFTRLAQVDPECYPRLRLRLHPAVRMVGSEHPVLAIWDANQSDRDGTLEGGTGAQRVLVRRDGEVARPTSITEQEFGLLRALEAGATLEDAGDPRLLARFSALRVFADFALDGAA